jgi:hypothetical protein
MICNGHRVGLFKVEESDMKNHALPAFPALLLICGFTPAITRADFVQTDLVSDISGVAPQTDADLKNPWGMSFSSKST